MTADERTQIMRLVLRNIVHHGVLMLVDNFTRFLQDFKKLLQHTGFILLRCFFRVHIVRVLSDNKSKLYIIGKHIIQKDPLLLKLDFCLLATLFRGWAKVNKLANRC